METQRFCQSLVFRVAGALLLPTIPSWALEDVPPGRTLWLQGYDQNPGSAAFRNEGTVRLECIDDALPITLSVAEPGLLNAEGGRVLVAPGAGGSREFHGSLRNLGEVLINYGILFTGVDRVVRNEATFRVAEVAAAWFLGPGIALEQAEGMLSTGGGLEVRDGEFRFLGGTISGEPRVVRSRMTVAESVRDPFSAVLAGDGSRYEGRLRAGQTLRLVASPDQGWSRTRLSLPAPLEGTVILTSSGAVGAALLETGEGLEVAESGVVRVEAGAGGAREVRGPLSLTGALEVRGAGVVLKHDQPWRPRGRVTVDPGGVLDVPAGLELDTGLVELSGGRIRSATGVSLRGGVLAGVGVMEASVTNATEIRAGGPTGTLRITGDLEQASGGSVVIFTTRDPSGHVPAQLEVGGEARLAGALRVATPPGMEWRDGDRIPLVISRRLTGSLDALELPDLPEGLHWELEAKSGALTARVESGRREPRLVMETGGEGKPRLRVEGALAVGITVESSTDLTTWTPVPVRVEIVGDAVILGGWEGPGDSLSVFFRPILR